MTRVYRRGDATPWRLLAEVRYEPLPVEGIAWDGRDLVLVAEGRGLFRLSRDDLAAPRPSDERLRPAEPQVEAK